MTLLLDLVIWANVATGFVGLAAFRARSPWLPRGGDDIAPIGILVTPSEVSV